VSYYKYVLNANDLVLNTLLYGYKPVFSVKPLPSFERNNKTARADLDFVRDEVSNLLIKGAVVKLDYQPTIVSPLSVSTRIDCLTKKSKKRLCIDLSRSLNNYLVIDPVTLNDIKCVLPRVVKDCYFTTWDLASMYHQVRLHPEVSDLFGFCVKDLNGVKIFYKYTVLPFGVSTAVYLVDQLIRPVKIFAHRLGVDISVYIDDGLTIELTYFKCLVSTYFVISVIIRAGWSFQISKCFLSPMKETVYLGYILNSTDMTISLPETKLVKMEFLLSQLIDAFENSSPVEARFLASFLGKLSHAIFSHGRFVKIVARMSNHALGLHVAYYDDWDHSLFINRDMHREFLLCSKYIRQFNGQSIFTEQKNFKIIEKHQTFDLVTQINSNDLSKQSFIFCSDSSDLESYAFKAGDCRIVSNYVFSPSEAQLSSGARELIAVVQSFKTFKVFFESNPNSVIIWVTDSMCLFSFLRYGSKIPHIQSLLLDIKELEFAFKISIYPKWIPRTDDLLKIADFGSRISNSTDEFGISDFDFLAVQDYFNVIVTLDAFASSLNFRVPKFISAVPQLNATGVDFFLTTLSSDEVIYFHPPIALIQRTFNKINLYEDITGLLVVPYWPSHPFWSVFVNAKNFHPCIKDFWIFNPFYITTSTTCMFNGYKNFPTIVFYIKTKDSHKVAIPRHLF